MHERLVEAIAWWRIGGDNGRRVLADAATELLVAGSASPAVAELAGTPEAENPFVVDDVIGRVIVDLQLESAFVEGENLLAVRHRCRSVLDGGLDERELTRWVHERFGHQDQEDAIDLLAGLDDEFDLAETGTFGSASEVRARVRDVAVRLVHGE